MIEPEIKPNTLNLSDAGQVKSDKETILKDLLNILWNKVYITSSFATGSWTTTSTTEDLTEAGAKATRESDTSERKNFSPDKASKFRTYFYLGTAQDKSTAYILSPGVSSVTTSPTTILNTNLSFVGLKIDQKIVSIVSSAKGREIEIITDKVIDDDTTHVLEINYYVNYAEIFLDNELLGSIECHLKDELYTYLTYFPFLSSLKSSDATSVNLTLESYQFMQEKR